MEIPTEAFQSLAVPAIAAASSQSSRSLRRLRRGCWMESPRWRRLRQRRIRKSPGSRKMQQRRLQPLDQMCAVMSFRGGKKNGFEGNSCKLVAEQQLKPKSRAVAVGHDACISIVGIKSYHIWPSCLFPSAPIYSYLCPSIPIYSYLFLSIHLYLYSYGFLMNSLWCIIYLSASCPYVVKSYSFVHSFVPSCCLFAKAQIHAISVGHRCPVRRKRNPQPGGDVEKATCTNMPKWSKWCALKFNIVQGVVVSPVLPSDKPWLGDVPYFPVF